jgi:hypothetical protein
MMRMTKGWTGLRTAVIALGLVAWTATGANAAPITLNYQTVTSLGPSGISGAPAINFMPFTGSLDLSGGSSNLTLGKFVAVPLPDGQTTTYDHVPFNITLLSQSLSGVGGSTSTVTATLNKPSPSMVNIGTQTLTLGVPDGGLSLVPSTSGGETTVQTHIVLSGINGAPVPEPSTVALFLTTLGGLGLRRYVQSRRRLASL